MRVTVDLEWWRVQLWWHKSLCRWFGHPGWRPPRANNWGPFNDTRLRCVRCHEPDPTEPLPEMRPYTFIFNHEGLMP